MPGYFGRPPVARSLSRLPVWNVHSEEFPQRRTQYSPDEIRDTPNTVVHLNVRFSQISLPERYPGLRPTARYVSNTG